MIDISSFVLRWMFLSNLCRDIMEVQVLPSLPQYHYHAISPHHHHHKQQQQLQPNGIHHHQLQEHPSDNSRIPSPSFHVEHHHQQQQQQDHQQYPSDILSRHHQHQQQPPSSSSSYSADATTNDRSSSSSSSCTNINQYKEQCWKQILFYPPGTYDRCRMINTLRQHLVQELQYRIQSDINAIQQYQQQQQQHNKEKKNVKSQTNVINHHDEQNERRNQEQDMNITNNTNNTSSDDTRNKTSFDVESSSLKQQHLNNNNYQETTTNRIISFQEYASAKQNLLIFRQYLPQLISIVLKSPPSLHENPDNDDSTSSDGTSIIVIDPIQQLRNIVLQQCVYDANMGIQICWLLEAEVGKTWKSLFEHKQQTGRRLIIVLPADKAIVLAKIGIEKRDAFDLLQDAEQATAFGYTDSIDVNIDPYRQFESQQQQDPQLPSSTRLPSSLSIRRCNHFGDTMQFIDRLSKISSDLRKVPIQYRYNVLHEQLHELNRRLRRRMISRGDISLDVDDYRSPYDWPLVEDMSVDMIVHSIHLPLIPQVPTWPNGKEEYDNSKSFHQQQQSPPPSSSSDSSSSSPSTLNTEVVRVLNIVVHESKLLSSRERCPFLIHVEVVDTGLEGNDARLYSTGTTDIGSTIGEALGIMNHMGSKLSDNVPPSSNSLLEEQEDVSIRTSPRSIVHYSIPTELLPHQIPSRTFLSNVQGIEENNSLDDTDPKQSVYNSHNAYIRGGSQSEIPYYSDGHDAMAGGYMVDPFDLVRQQEYEQLHYHLQQHTQQRQYDDISSTPAPILPQPIVPKISVGKELLDNVFGREWREKCQEIRDASPYGHIKGWRLSSFIMKAGEDIRRESFVMQIISKLKSWFDDEIPEDVRPYMRPYTIMCVGGDAGLLECLSDAKSVDEVKKRTDGYTSLRDYFERAYGVPRKPAAFIPTTSSSSSADATTTTSTTAHVGPEGRHQLHRPLDPFGLRNHVIRKSGHITFEIAQHNFLRSLVGYSLVCYILQIKDRHNANILLDRLGHIMHIDFGYVLGDTPKMGKVPIFSERAPFKLSNDFWEVLGGWNIADGGLGVKFCKMFELAFQCASNHADEIAALTEAAVLSLDSNPRNARTTANSVRARLRMRGAPGSREQKLFIMELVNAALTSWGTSTYDWLQRNMNGYQ